MKKTFQQLDLNNAFLFAAALEDPDTCQLILEIILESKLPKVNVHAEHSVFVSSDFRSVRFDIYASDEFQVHYNIEAQNRNQNNLPKRSRYYQAEMDIASLKPGEDFNQLKPSYIIFICSFDPFGHNLYRYTFEERCLEKSFSLGDETRKIFLNTKGKNRDEVSSELINFLGYMENSTDEYVQQITDPSIFNLHNRVKALKSERALEARYMTFEELLNQREEHGKAEGITESILIILEDKGDISDEIRSSILKESDEELLLKWLKLAVRTTSIDEFLQNM